VAFKGADLDGLIPDFSTERDVSVGLKWFPCATGPETWTLVVAASLPLAAFLKKFGDLLAADLYTWVKSKLGEFFSQRPNSQGFLVIELESVVLRSASPVEVLSCDELVATLATIDLSSSTDWEIIYDSETCSISFKPSKAQTSK
jgi:hypothetical protein